MQKSRMFQGAPGGFGKKVGCSRGLFQGASALLHEGMRELVFLDPLSARC